tara:strand:+ start:1111 stop:1902 length:792 start_codon:yes stop_codon:yes gene_type:complete
MSFKGNLIDDRYVLFGKPLNEKTKVAISKGCPDGASIVNGLPDEDIYPVGETKIIEEQVIEEKPKVSKRKKRIAERKKLAKQKQKAKTIISNIVYPEEDMSLDSELDGLLNEAKPKQQEPQPQVITQEESRAGVTNQIVDMLVRDPNSPDADEIEAWKDKYGRHSIHAMSFGESDNYIYHHLTRGEWKKIKEVMKVLKESENADELEEKLKERVVLGCVLWPAVSDEWLDNCKAGVIDSLYQMILLNSGFLTPQQSMLLTTQL